MLTGKILEVRSDVNKLTVGLSDGSSVLATWLPSARPSLELDVVLTKAADGSYTAVSKRALPGGPVQPPTKPKPEAPDSGKLIVILDVSMFMTLKPLANIDTKAYLPNPWGYSGPLMREGIVAGDFVAYGNPKTLPCGDTGDFSFYVLNTILASDPPPVGLQAELFSLSTAGRAFPPRPDAPSSLVANTPETAVRSFNRSYLALDNGQCTYTNDYSVSVSAGDTAAEANRQLLLSILTSKAKVTLVKSKFTQPTGRLAKNLPSATMSQLPAVVLGGLSAGATDSVELYYRNFILDTYAFRLNDGYGRLFSYVQGLYDFSNYMSYPTASTKKLDNTYTCGSYNNGDPITYFSIISLGAEVIRPGSQAAAVGFSCPRNSVYDGLVTTAETFPTMADNGAQAKGFRKLLPQVSCYASYFEVFLVPFLSSEGIDFEFKTVDEINIDSETLYIVPPLYDIDEATEQFIRETSASTSVMALFESTPVGRTDFTSEPGHGSGLAKFVEQIVPTDVSILDEDSLDNSGILGTDALRKYAFPMSPIGPAGQRQLSNWRQKAVSSKTCTVLANDRLGLPPGQVTKHTNSYFTGLQDQQILITDQLNRPMAAVFLNSELNI